MLTLLQCDFNPPDNGMKLVISGHCLDLSLISLPDAAGTVQVRFNSSLTGSVQEYTFSLTVIPNNDPPAFRLNCSTHARRLWGSGTPIPWAIPNACAAACSDPDSSTGEGPCFNMEVWQDIVTPMFVPACSKYEQDQPNCDNHISIQSENCGVVGKEACCVCGGGAANRPLINPGDCSITVTIVQLTPAERTGAQVEVPESAASPYPYNNRISSQACIAAIELQHAAIDMMPSPWKSAADEQYQNLTFSVHPVDHQNIARFFSPFAQPSIDATGTLTLCLERGKTHGVIAFDVFIQDDGGVEHGGSNTYGPARLNVEILPVNQEPSFELCCGSAVHAVHSTGLHVLPAFIVNICKGERDESGRDLEASQNISFTVVVLPDVSEQMFVKPPRVHVNGTLEFTLRDGASGMAQVYVSMKDDGGNSYGGIDSSRNISFDIAVSSAYLEIVLSGIPPEGSAEQQAMCDIATDLQISCGLVVKAGPGIYHVRAGTMDALLHIGQRAEYVKSIGRGPLPRTIDGSLDSTRDRRLLEWPFVDPKDPDGGQGWEAWMIPAGTEYITLPCLSSGRHAPSCEVNLAGVPASSLLFLTIDIVHTDFREEDEFISSVTAGSKQLGQSFLVSGGSDQECNVSTRILDTVPIEEQLVSESGVLTVRLATTSSVGMFMCEGSSLMANVSLMANSLHVLSAKIMRPNLNHGVGSFEMAQSQFTMTGYEYPGSHPLVLENFIANIVEPSDTELDLQGRARLIFTVRPIRYKPHITIPEWTHDGSDGGLLLGFQSEPATNGSEVATTASPWYSCRTCIQESSKIPGEDFVPIRLHRTELDGMTDARIVNLTLTLAQSHQAPNGIVLSFPVHLSHLCNTPWQCSALPY